MRKALTSLIAMLAMGIGCGGVAQTPNDATSSALDAQSGHEPPMLGLHFAKGQGGHQPSSNPDLLPHSYGVMTSTVNVHPIFWGTSWSDSSYVDDKISGLQGFYNAVGGSPYLGTNTEYTSASGTHVTTDVQLAPEVVDLSAAPTRNIKTSAILAEVCKQFPAPNSNDYYPVYTDTPRGHASYCAWHSWSSCNGIPVQFAFFFSLDGDSGCSPTSGSAGGRSQGLIALANVSGHELSEFLTDARGAGWYDSSGAENSDKCAWVFDQPAQLIGSTWMIQGNWSNKAYDTNTGFPNRSGQNGCLYNN